LALLSVSLAWESFGRSNSADSEGALERARSGAADPLMIADRDSEGGDRHGTRLVWHNEHVYRG
jgi:hypothetical protein